MWIGSVTVSIYQYIYEIICRSVSLSMSLYLNVVVYFRSHNLGNINTAWCIVAVGTDIHISLIHQSVLLRIGINIFIWRHNFYVRIAFRREEWLIFLELIKKETNFSCGFQRRTPRKNNNKFGKLNFFQICRKNESYLCGGATAHLLG